MIEIDSRSVIKCHQAETDSGGIFVKSFFSVFVASLVAFVSAMLIAGSVSAATSRWSEQQAQSWSVTHGWTVGANYIPASASNTIEMWQAETFDPVRIDSEFAIGEQLGFKSMRIFLNDLVWQADPKGFAARLDTVLALSAKHGLRPLLVLFDSCWNPSPQLGPQPQPIPGVHNSRWVQVPSLAALLDPSERPRLQAYVQGVIKRFGQDSRIYGWDLWNEPDNLNSGTSHDPDAKLNAVADLLPQVFQWARAMDPTQPLTSGVWAGDWSNPSTLRPIEKLQIELSDVVSFHNYEAADRYELKVKQLQQYNRPLICTEYMARPFGSTVQNILPIAKREHVDSFNWGFVAGKTQTNYPWDSWQNPYAQPPAVWFHDLIQPDGTHYDVRETDFIISITGRTLHSHASLSIH